MVKDFQHRTMILRLKPALREKKSWDVKQFQNKKTSCATYDWNSFTFLAYKMGWSEPFFANVLESVSNTTLQYNVTCFRFVLPIGIFFMSHRKSIIMKHWNFYFFVYMIIML